MSAIVHPSSAGLVAPADSAHLVKSIDNARRGLAEVAPGVTVPTEFWLCRSHGRHVQRKLKLAAGDVHRALIDAVLDNVRFRKRCGDVANAAALTAQLLAVRPWCCYLSAPERKAAFALAAARDLEDTLKKRMDERKERARELATRRAIATLAATYRVMHVEAAYALHAFNDAGLAAAALAQAQREGAAVKDVVDAIRAAL